VDIKLGPDGAIYVSDFYNKIIGHYEVDLKHPDRDKDHGRIWRIVYKGTDGKAPAPKFPGDFTKLKPEELETLFETAGTATKLTILNELIARFKADGKLFGQMAKAAAMNPKHNPAKKAPIIWWGGHWTVPDGGSAEMLGVLLMSTAQAAPGAPDEIAYQLVHGLRVAASIVDWKGAKELAAEVKARLLDANPHVQRAAVEAVIMHPHADFVPSLLEVLKKAAADDSHLKHAARVALRNCLRDAAEWPKQYDATFTQIAFAVPNKKAADYLLAQIESKSLPPEQLAAATEHIARNTDEFDEPTRWGYLKADKYSPVVGDAVQAAFRAIQTRGKAPSDKMLTQAVVLLDQELNRKTDEPLHPDNIRRLTSLVRALTGLPADTAVPAGTTTALMGFVNETKTPFELRASSADALLRVAPTEGYPALRKLLADPTLPLEFRHRLLLAFATSSNKEARLDARDAIKDAPYRTAVAVGLALASSPGGAEDLLTAVKLGKAPARLLQEKAILERLRGARIPDLDKQLALLTKGLPAPDARLAELIKKRSVAFASAKADKELGAKLFTKHCAACHKIGEMGGKIAPQLDGIGLRGAERILEDILDPNRNVDQAFRARVITTKDEKTITGLMLRVEGEVLVVADGEGKEIRVPTKDIEANRETMLSPMPANFGDVVPEGEFVHLIAYLLDQKIPAAKKE
jgi:putative heme-binding domain-containing protein